MTTNTLPQNHMEIYWHDYASQMEDVKIRNASLTEKASIIGRTGLMLLSCGTGAWRVRSSMNSVGQAAQHYLHRQYRSYVHRLHLFRWRPLFFAVSVSDQYGVNTSKLNRLEHFIQEFPENCENLSGEQLHAQLDEIEQLHGLYSPVALGFAARSGVWLLHLSSGWRSERNDSRLPWSRNR